MAAVLDREAGLRAGRLLSDVFVFEDPLREERGGALVAITDGGITPLPTLAQKRAILENAVGVYHRLGCAAPNVAVMSAAEKVDGRIASTTDARALVEMHARGEITGCVVEGPMALDVAALAWCAERKGIRSAVAGAVDIMLMPSIEAGNMLAKAFAFLLRRRIGHVIAGARAPILINSRTDDAAARLNSIALSILAGTPA
jgi:phosphate butyryltransferase